MARAHDPEQHERHDEDAAEDAGAADQTFQRIPAVAEQVSDDRDRGPPDDRARGVEEQKRAPAHAAAAGEDRAEDAKAGDEPRHEHGLRAVAIEEAIELCDPARGDADLAAESLDQSAAAPAADEEPQIVAEDRRDDGDHDDADEREMAVMRQRPAR